MSQCYQPAAHFPNKQSDQSCFRLAIHLVTVGTRFARFRTTSKEFLPS